MEARVPKIAARSCPLCFPELMRRVQAAIALLRLASKHVSMSSASAGSASPAMSADAMTTRAKNLVLPPERKISHGQEWISIQGLCAA
jgi:hypothetical protein